VQIVFFHFKSNQTVFAVLKTRAVPEFGSGSGQNPVFFANPADIRLRPELGRMSAEPDLENFHK